MLASDNYTMTLTNGGFSVAFKYCGLKCDVELQYFNWEVRIFQPVIFHTKSRDNVVGIATGYGLKDRGIGVRVPVGSRIFSSAGRPQEREVDHSPPDSAEVKKMWLYTSTPPYAFMA
jgi:hypothetical protein